MATRLALLALCLLVLLPLYWIYKPPNLLIKYLQHGYPEVLFHIPTTQKLIALTIDDAPSEFTLPILDLLREHGAKATFFTIGSQIPGREDVLRQILRAGSEIGNHAMHDEPSINLSSQVLKDEILRVDEVINEIYASVNMTRSSSQRYFRPGSGIFSQRILDLAKGLGYRTVLGSIYPHDPFVKLWRVNAWNILSGVQPGAVVICHDRRGWTMPMLQRVVPEVVRRGYRVVTVSELLAVQNEGQT